MAASPSSDLVREMSASRSTAVDATAKVYVGTALTVPVMIALLTSVPLASGEAVAVNTKLPDTPEANVGVYQMSVSGGPGSSVKEGQVMVWSTTPPKVTPEGKLSVRLTP